MPLEDEEQKHLDAAQGFLELGMLLDADAELDRIDPFCRHLPEVLEVRLRIYTALNRWELAQTVAKRLAQYEPEEPSWALSWAKAARHADGLPRARQILIESMQTVPDAAMLHFYLACIECQMGNIVEAKEALRKAITLDANLRQTALDEPDLAAVWDDRSDESLTRPTKS